MYRILCCPFHLDLSGKILDLCPARVVIETM